MNLSPERVASGMELGLTTTYAIVKNHKGRLVVTSKAGEGTTVTIFLPALHKFLNGKSVSSNP
ncbi:MAG: HAMP domain-containing histidine kinase [Deltaproteobacteria bacterium]|nr:HAMP domain-containing histidine kinase [Deltaproteobacteria bacterium]